MTTMTRPELETAALFVLLICLGAAAAEPKLRCKESEREALLEFRQELYEFTAGALSSWSNEDSKSECCEWRGIRCDDVSGHVTRLDLSPSTFDWTDFGGTPVVSGNLSSSLLGLAYLNYLDLSHISFYEADSIPSFIGGLRRLKYLNLSYTGITGEVPPELGNLSALEVLDLSDIFKWTKTMRTMDWVSRLSSLKILDLSFIDISLAKDWVSVVSDLPKLSNLRLRFSHLSDVFPLFVNSSRNLAFVDLSGNNLSLSGLFRWLANYESSLVRLELNTCFFKSPIPEGLGRMTSLEYLNLGGNLLEGPIPDSIGNLTAMTFLVLGNNQLRGPIPESLGNMAGLEYLDLGANLLGGEVPRSIWEICTLKNFQAHENNLTGKLLFSKSSSKCAHFSLELLNLETNRIEGPLPDFTLYPSLVTIWLQSNQLNGISSESIGQLSKLETLDVSENSIEAVITEAHLSKLYRLRYLDLSSNSDIVFDIGPDWTPSFKLDYILLQSCKLGPSFPNWLRNQKTYTELDISNSGILDSIPNWFWNLPKTVLSLNLSNNQITATNHNNNPRFNELVPFPTVDLSSNHLRGSVPMFLFSTRILRLSRNNFSDLNSLCSSNNTLSLSLLDISHNRLSGKLPDCWSIAPNMEALILSHNWLSGKIPSSIGFMNQISALHLSYNKFSGGLPYSLRNCTQLMVLDAGENELSGSIPAWIGTSLTNLVILSLRSNKFSGSILSQLCHLQHLQVLDLSYNNFSGSIPKCVVYFEEMKVTGSGNLLFGTEGIFLVWKGIVSEFMNLGLLRNFDLSSNELAGEIPGEIVKLSGLVSLNLSRNKLTGQIPRKIGRLKFLDALDLSNNDLSGTIPSSLAEVDRLSVLDLSRNRLSGKIPTGPQLQTRDAAAYSGNLELCGDPLPNKCPEPSTGSNNSKHDGDNHDGFITRGFYVSLGLGFVIGFWGICGSLLFVKSWRYAYYRFLNGVGDWFYVMIALRKAKLLRIIKH